MAIGSVGDPLLVGDSFERSYCWKCHTAPPDCGFEPVDYTGYVPTARILDADGNVLDTFTVTPDPGDDTGTFTVVLTPAQTTTTLRDNATTWTLTVTYASVNKTLIKAPFTVT